MKNFIKTVLAILILCFVMSSCGVEEIDACVGAASDPITYDFDCDDCCETNGYKRGIVRTTNTGGNTTRSCRCSGELD